MGKKEETKGNRETRDVIISLQFCLGCGRQRWVALPWLLLLSAGGGVEASLQERLLPLAAYQCQWTPGPEKGQVKDFFHSRPDSVSFLFRYTTWLSRVLWTGGMFPSTGRIFCGDWIERQGRKESYYPSAPPSLLPHKEKLGADASGQSELAQRVGGGRKIGTLPEARVAGPPGC